MSTVKKTNIKLGKHCSSFCGEGLISLGHKSSEKSIRINNNKKSIRINREREPTPNSSQEELRVTSSAWQMVDLAQERRAREINAEGTRERLTGEFLSRLRLGTARLNTVSIAQASRGWAWRERGRRRGGEVWEAAKGRACGSWSSFVAHCALQPGRRDDDSSGCHQQPLSSTISVLQKTKHTVRCARQRHW